MTVVEKEQLDRTLREVDPSTVDPNEDNPRGQDPEQIQADDDFTKLRDSVRRFGVLVPLVVRRAPHGRFDYTLIDGERRLRAALSVNARKVPIRIVDDVSEDAVAQSFHIHSLRKQWDPIAYVHSVKGLIKKLCDKDPSLRRNEAVLRREVARLTGLGRADLERYVRTALRYSDKQLKEVDSGAVGISHIWEIEERFIEPVRLRFPGFFGRVGEDVVRDRLLEKAKREVLVGAQALRDLSPLLSEELDQRQHSFAEKLLQDFVKTPDMAPDEVVHTFRERFPQGRDDLLEFADTINNSAKQIRVALGQLDVKELRKLHPGTALRLSRTMKALARKIGEAFS